MKNIKQIRPVVFLRGDKIVVNKRDANFVKLITRDGFLTLRKDLLFDKIKWEELPETVSF